MRLMKVPPNPLDAEVGARLRARRRVLGMTQGEFGAAVDLSAQQISKYESGRSELGASQLYYMAKILGVEPAY